MNKVYYDLFVIPNLVLDSNYNYDIKLITNSNLDISKLTELVTDIQKDEYFDNYTKNLYYISLSCLVDIKEYLSYLHKILNELNIKSNLDYIIIKLNKK